MKNLKYLFAILIAILTLTANAFATCEPGDTSCTETTDVFGNVNVGFNRLHGDEINGGFQSLAGSLCGISNGDAASSFMGSINALAEGAYDESTGTSFSRSVMNFTGTATNNVGTSEITALGAVSEGSYVARNNNADYYTKAGQFAGATMDTTTTSTETQRELNFAASLNAEGLAGSTFTVDGASKGVTAFASNLASGPTTAFAANEIGGGVMNANAAAEFGGTAAINCPGGAVATNGFGSAAITQTDLTNGFTLNASVAVGESVSKQ